MRPTAGSIERVYGERRGSMDDLRERLINAGDLTQWVWEDTIDTILTEIAKTHRLVKLGDGPHGTYSRYTNGRCRCDLCREANRERGRRYRKEIKERENG
jgi:hypothetical protein